MTSNTTVPTSGPSEAGAKVSIWLILLCCLGAFMAFLDSTIVNVAFPSISADFTDSDLPTLSWVLNGYNVVVAAFLMPAGRAADIIGSRRAFAIGLLIFVLGSALCGAANSAEMLIAMRVVQAAGAAILVPTSAALLMAMFPSSRRLIAITIWGAAAALAAGIGPGLGGLLTEYTSWRAIFLINLPIGVVALVGTRWLTEMREENGAIPDVFGAIGLAGSLGLIALGVVKAPDWGWTDPTTLACLAVGAALGLWVVLRSRRHPAPVLALDLLRTRAALGGNIGSMLFSVTFFAVILNNVIFLNAHWGWTVLQAGLATTPPPIATAIVARPASKIAEKWGDRNVAILGCAVYVLGTLLLVHGGGQDPDFLRHWLPGAAVMGAGAGLVWPVLANVAVEGVEPARLASATAANAAFRQLGAVLGTALTISIISSATMADPLGTSRTVWFMAIGFAVATGVFCAVTVRGITSPTRISPDAAGS